MNEVTTATSHYIKQFAEQDKSSLQQEPAWLQNIRKSAMNDFSKRGFPHSRDEDWKYTNISAIEKRPFFPVITNEKLDLDETIKHHTLPGTLLLVSINGHISKKHSFIADTHKPTIAISIVDAIKLYPEKVEPFFNIENSLRLATAHSSNSFSDLNTALMQDGTFIYIPDNYSLELPIQLLHIATPAHETSKGVTESTLISPINLIYVGKNSRLTLIENFISTDSHHSKKCDQALFETTPYLTNTITKIRLDESAHIEHLKCQQENISSYHIGTLSIHQMLNSQCVSHAVSIGARLYRQAIDVYLDAEGATCHLNGFYFEQGKQHVDYHTTIDHLQPHTTSKECFKGILDDKSRGVFNGKIIVRKNAQKINSEQTNHTMLLSDDAEIDTKPQLEIEADDVKCMHGATVGQLDESALFFLRSRGLSEESARSLLIHAFANTFLNQISFAATRDYIQQLLLDRLPAGDAVRELL
jgi:Fe-S cluster assembly protein SufD